MATDDFFRARLETMIDMRHALAVLATRMPWAQIARVRHFRPVFERFEGAGLNESRA